MVLIASKLFGVLNENGCGFVVKKAGQNMNRIVIIGNGFDLAHGLKTSYRHFIDKLWEKEEEKFGSYDFVDCIDLDSGLHHKYESDFIRIRVNFPVVSKRAANGYGYDWFKNLNTPGEIKVEIKNVFLETISEKTYPQETADMEEGQRDELNERLSENSLLQNWVDIEEEYSNELKNCLTGKRTGGIKKLNKEFSEIKTALGEYLERLQKNVSPKNEIHQHLKMDSHNGTSIGNTLFLNFNYTDTIEPYARDIGPVIYIHGKLNAPENPIIFGYGNEQDETHKLIEAKNDNEYLRHIKSIEYLKTNNYKRLQAFFESDEYEIFIMGHSCGNSDRTLLNNLFEHKHCRSIRVFYYKRADGTDDYFDLECNIYRNFNDKNAMRNKVVSKEDCVPLL